MARRGFLLALAVTSISVPGHQGSNTRVHISDVRKAFGSWGEYGGRSSTVIQLEDDLPDTIERRGEDMADETYEGEYYCVKCKTKRQAKGNVVVNAKGTRMAKATCPECGTKLNRILGKA